MYIVVIGSGYMGATLGKSWAEHGHTVFFTYTRDFARLQKLAESVGHGAQASDNFDPIAKADAVLIAVHWDRVDDVLKLVSSLKDKILLTCMLPMNADDSQLVVGFTTSGAEVLAQKTGARVIEVFNTVWSNAIATPNAGSSMFYVGDDEKARQVAEQLIKDAGFEPVYAGGLITARLLEPFGVLMGQLGIMYDPLVTYRFLKP